MQVQTSVVDLTTPTGPMRVAVYQPKLTSLARRCCYIQKFSRFTAPIARMAAMLSGQGLLVLVPEVFHELNAPGTVLAYDDAGKDKGNQDKWTKPLRQYDSDNRAMIHFLGKHPLWNGRLGAMGVCIGGHLALRAALQPEVQAALCYTQPICIATHYPLVMPVRRWHVWGKSGPVGIYLWPARSACAGSGAAANSTTAATSRCQFRLA